MGDKPSYEELERRNRELERQLSRSKQAERELGIFRRLAEVAGYGFGMADIDGYVQYVNQALSAMMGHAYPEAARGTNVLTYYPDRVKDEVVDKILPTVMEEGQWVGDLPLLSVNGRETATIQNIFLVRAEAESPAFLVNLLIDIEERKKLRARLQRAEKMETVGMLAGGVAHDLNNILTGLVGLPDLLLMDLDEDSPIRESLLAIQDSGKRAAAIVDDLLTLARRGVHTSGVVDMNGVVREYLLCPVHATLKMQFEHVNFSVALQDDLMNIVGSSVHLSTSIMNLVSNAAESVQKGGTVKISTRNQYVDRPILGYDDVKEGDYVVLSVADDGAGISSEDLAKVFEPFYTRKVMGRSGTGLGLAVVWGTVKDHQGYVMVESALGRGSTFEIYLPATREEMRSEAAPTAGHYRGNGETILVVDDIEQQRKIASALLSRLGYEVEAVSSGEAAVEYMGTHTADLLVLDMIMEPGIDGLDTYRRILKQHPGQRAIITSGFSETERVRKAQRLGAGCYIKKPYTFERIAQAVKVELARS